MMIKINAEIRIVFMYSTVVKVFMARNYKPTSLYASKGSIFKV